MKECITLKIEKGFKEKLAEALQWEHIEYEMVEEGDCVSVRVDMGYFMRCSQLIHEIWDNQRDLSDDVRNMIHADLLDVLELEESKRKRKEYVITLIGELFLKNSKDAQKQNFERMADKDILSFVNNVFDHAAAGSVVLKPYDDKNFSGFGTKDAENIAYCLLGWEEGKEPTMEEVEEKWKDLWEHRPGLRSS